MAECTPELVDCSRADASQMGFELGKGHFDRIEVWRVGRQEQEPCAAFLEHGGSFWAFMAGEIVEDHDIAALERGRELCFDPCLEEVAVHGLINDPWRGQAIAA